MSRRRWALALLPLVFLIGACSQPAEPVEPKAAKPAPEQVFLQAAEDMRVYATNQDLLEWGRWICESSAQPGESMAWLIEISRAGTRFDLTDAESEDLIFEARKAMCPKKLDRPDL